ncbi:MAG: hypothetical protein AAB276_05555 [Pseudomonadota bacterium]
MSNQPNTQSIIFDLKTQPQEEVGAAILALLTASEFTEYKNSREDRESAILGISTKACYERAIFSGDNFKARTLDRIFQMPNNSVKITETAIARINKLMVVARAASFFLKYEINPEEVKKLVPKLSMPKVIEFMKNHGEIFDWDNFRLRFWNPSKKVLHWLVAIQIAINHGRKSGILLTSIGDLIWDRDLLIEVANLADEFAISISKSQLKIGREDLLKISLVY